MKYIVTGGGGFVGKNICLHLAGQGHEVISLSRKHYPELEKQQVKSVQVDLAVLPDKLLPECCGADAVFHTAAKVQMWGRYQDFYRSNVLGTRNIIELCRRLNIPKLIYTSSPSVVADGHDLNGVDESYPYPQRYKSYYPQTKAMAEQEVLAANNTSLRTLALRPHLIWGPGDTNLVPTIIKRARTGKLLRIGAGKNIVDTCFIDDCLQAHLLALNALESNPSSCGRAYFISQGEPVNLWQWIDQILVLNGLPALKRSLAKAPAMILAGMMESLSRLLPGNHEPLLTRFLVSEMATNHYFCIDAARKELGYEPKYGVREAMEKTFAAAQRN